MRTLRKVLVWVVLVVVFLPLPAIPQDPPKTFKPEEIDQLVAPIALHPDALVAQILMASTYPLEVVQAARFVKENPSLKGDQLDEALKQQSWDDSVKSLVFFPQVLTMLNEKLDWLQKLGDAFLAQQQDVLASIQRLRARAQSAGQLKSTPEQQVIVEPAVAAAPPPPAAAPPAAPPQTNVVVQDRKSTRLKSSHVSISYAVFCLKKKKKNRIPRQRESRPEQYPQGLDSTSTVPSG